MSRFELAVQINQFFCALKVSVTISGLIVCGAGRVGYCRFPCCRCHSGRGMLERYFLIHGDQGQSIRVFLEWGQ